MLEVKEQVRLPFQRLFEICVGSISYRLMRSAVTVVIIVLAIAFLAQIMMDGYLGRAARDTAQSHASRLTAYSRFLSHVSFVDADEQLLARFATVRPGTAAFENLRRWGEFDAVQTGQFVTQAADAERYLQFFRSIPAGRRALLIEQREGTAILDRLGMPSNRGTFERQLAQMKSVRLPGEHGEFTAFLDRWPDFRAQLDRVKKNYAATVARIAEFCGGRELGAALGEAVSGGKTDAFFARIGELGYAVDSVRIADIVGGFEYQQRVEWAFAQLKTPAIRTGWTREFHEQFSPGSALASCADSAARTGWVQRTLAEAGLGKDFDTETFRAIAAEYRDREKVLTASQHLLGRYGASATLGDRTIWLIVVSFLVCVVGIANAMLMSVLERFKEIATMKCLGARNQTIAFLFVTESMIIGLVGGIAGTVLGILIVFARQSVAYGSLLFERIPWGDMGTTFVACFCCSLLLAAIAAIYPAGVAARMAPMEAMRVD